MKKTLLFIAVATSLSISASSASAITLTFTTNDETDNTAFPSADSTDPVLTSAFGTRVGDANPDFRVVLPGSGIAGGGEKAISAGVSWTFDGISNSLTSVANSENTPGAATYQTNAGDSSAAPAGDVGLFKNALFLESPFGFLAPTIGSAAGNAYGAATISGDLSGNGAFSIFFPVLEAQWNGAPFTVGKYNGGTTFNCAATAGVFACQAEVLIAQPDDSLGFAGQYLQFDLTGTMVPVPAAVWLFGSGLLGLAGVARRRKAS